MSKYSSINSEAPVNSNAGYQQPYSPVNPNAGYQQSYPPGNPNAGGYQQSYPPGNPNAGYQQSYPPGNPNAGYQQSYPPGNPNAGYQQSYPPDNLDVGYQQPGGYSNQPHKGDFHPGGMSSRVAPTNFPSAPNVRIAGYENLSFNPEILPPPFVPPPEPEIQTRQEITGMCVFSEEEVRDAVIQYVAQHCCYGSKPAREMALLDIQILLAFHYKLETFTEKRECAWAYKPFSGEVIDGPSNGPAPSPWSIPASPSMYFKDSHVKVEVPHTAFVKPCHECVGNCRVRCGLCDGLGQATCHWCKGSGRNDDNRCNNCSGTGRARCRRCAGTGQEKCKTCDARGNVKGFVQLTVTWTNHVEDYVSQIATLPKEVLLEVTGDIALDEERLRVSPITHSPDLELNRASNELIARHNSCFPNEVIMKQRHCLRIVPVTKARYKWKTKGDLFYIYGFERKVHFPDYPDTCACCTLL